MTVETLDLGPFGQYAAGTNLGDKGVQDGAIGTGGWIVAGGILYSPNQKKDMVAAEYGWAAAFLDHKEVGPLLLQAAENGWTEQKLMTELRKTDWWKNTTEAQRQWQSLKAQDPAEAAKRIDDTSAKVQQIASQVGGQLSADDLAMLAERTLRNGWTDQDLTNAVTLQLMRDGQADQIRGGVIGRELRAQADAMAIPLSDKAVDSWMKRIAKGNATIEDFNNYTRNQAKGLYAALADDIDRGLSVKDLADPYAQSASRILGLTGEQIDFTRGKWNQALNFVDSSGKRRTMTLAEWEDTLRTDQRYGYQNTEEATTKAYAVADAITKMFGKVG